MDSSFTSLISFSFHSFLLKNLQLETLVVMWRKGQGAPQTHV